MLPPRSDYFHACCDRDLQKCEKVTNPSKKKKKKTINIFLLPFAEVFMASDILSLTEGEPESRADNEDVELWKSMR